MKKRIVILLLFVPFLVNAQKFMVFDIDSSLFPILSAKYLIFDDNDLLVEDVKYEDFKVNLGSEELSIKNVTPPERSKKVQKASIVLTIDISGSMSGQNLAFAKQAALLFIKMTPLHSIEIAVTTFDDANYINLDFSKNKEKLNKSVKKIKAFGGTNYDEGLMNEPAGALEIMTNAQYEKKIIIFLTDGLGTGNHNSIIIDAKKQGAVVYPITVNMPMPDVLSIISEGTDGEVFENISTVKEAEDAYIRILSGIMDIKLGEITWEIQPVCKSANTNLTLSFRNQKFLVPFTYPSKMLMSLIPNNDLLDFGNVPVGDTAYNRVLYTAKNENFEILEINNQHPELFTIIPPYPFPVKIPKGKSVEFIVQYVPNDTVFMSDKFSVVTDKCSARSVLVYGGNPPKDPYNSNLYLSYPNGGEKLGISSKSKVNWEGVSVFDSVHIALSVDSGKTYNYIGSGSNLEYQFVVPGKKSDYCLMKITHKMLSYMQYELKLSLSARHAEFMKDDATIFMSGSRFVGTMNMRNGGFNNIYTPRKQMNVVELSPDESQFFEINNEQITFRNTNDFKVQQEIKPFKIFGIKLKKIHKKPISVASYSSDGQRIATIGRDGELKIWDIQTGKNILKTKVETYSVDEIKFAPDTNLLIIISRTNLFIYNSDNLKLVKEFETKKNITDAIFYENSNKIMITQKNGIIQSYETNAWTPDFEHQIPKNKTSKIELDPTAERIAVLHDKGISVYLFPDFIHQFDVSYNLRVKDFGFSNDGMRLVTTAGTRVPVWSAYKRVAQMDVSDEFFSIEGGLPDVKPVIIKPTFISYNKSEYVTEFLYNSNAYPIEIQDIKFAGADATKFGLISGFPPFKIPAYSGKDVEFSYSSNEVGKDQAEIIIIVYSDTIRTTISAEAKPIPFDLTNSVIDFGTLKKDEHKTKKVSVLKNISREKLVIEQVYEIGGDDGQFSMNTKLVGKVLFPGEELFFDVTYNATIPRRTSMTYKLFFEGVDQAINVSLKGNCFVPKNVLLSGNVTDMLTAKPISATVRVFDIASNSEVLVGAVNTNNVGKYQVRMSMDRKFRVEASSSGYSTLDTMIDLTVFTSIAEMTKNFQLEPDFSQIDAVVMNLLFDTDKYSLVNSEKQKMNGLIAFLKKSTDLKIEILGHTDNEGDDDHNMQLSQNRANSVKNYMISMGISSSRISTIGFGATKPVSENDTEEGRQDNRRVEIKFTKSNL